MSSPQRSPGLPRSQKIFSESEGQPSESDGTISVYSRLLRFVISATRKSLSGAVYFCPREATIPSKYRSPLLGGKPRNSPRWSHAWQTAIHHTSCNKNVPILQYLYTVYLIFIGENVMIVVLTDYDKCRCSLWCDSNEQNTQRQWLISWI